MCVGADNATLELLYHDHYYDHNSKGHLMHADSNISIVEAKAQFADLIRRAEAGERITVTRHGRPVAQITALEGAASAPLIGALKGRIEIAEDFDDLPEAMKKSLNAPVEPV